MTSPTACVAALKSQLAAVAVVIAALGAGCAKTPEPYMPGIAGNSGGGFSGACGAVDTSVPIEPLAALPWLHTEGNAIKDEQGNTVVLRGLAFPDLGNLQNWEGGINKMIDRVTNPRDAQSCSPGWATRVVRLDVAPDDSGVVTPNQYPKNAGYYANVLRPTVEYARSKGLYVIIDWHYIDDTSEHRATTARFWTEMAPLFAGDSNVLFELYNEPINRGAWSSLKADMQAWYDIVRAAAPNNLVLVGTPSWCQEVGDAAADPITGTNVAYVAHMYPYHWSVPSLREQITAAAAKVPVFVTEWGFQGGASNILDGTVSSYGAPFKQFVNDLGLSWTAWCASTNWDPPIFAKNFSLLVGENEMGGFAKDWLFEKAAADLPSP